MVMTPSTMMLALGAKAPEFQLPDPFRRVWSLADFEGAPALVVAFICNHCPFVKHVRTGFAEQRVIMAITVERVVSITAGENIIINPAVQSIVVLTTAEVVVAGATFQGIVTFAARELIVARASE